MARSRCRSSTRALRLRRDRLEHAQHGRAELLQNIRAILPQASAGPDDHRRGEKENIIAAAQAGASYIVKPFTAATLSKSSKDFRENGQEAA